METPGKKYSPTSWEVCRSCLRGNSVESSWKFIGKLSKPWCQQRHLNSPKCCSGRSARTLASEFVASLRHDSNLHFGAHEHSWNVWEKRKNSTILASTRKSPKHRSLRLLAGRHVPLQNTSPKPLDLKMTKLALVFHILKHPFSTHIHGQVIPWPKLL